MREAAPGAASGLLPMYQSALSSLVLVAGAAGMLHFGGARAGAAALVARRSA